MAKKLSEEIATRKRSINFYSLGTYLPDPDIVLRKQGKDVRIYKELLCDPHVFACVQSRKAGVLSLEWDLNRGLDKDKNAELVEKVLKKLNLNKIINDILDAVLFGFTPIEVMWGKVENYILPLELKAKPPEWFCFDDGNQLKFRTKEHYFGEELPPRKFLCPQSNPSYENPYGERVLSRVFWPVTFKKGGLKFWVVFTEKYGMPHLVGKHPRGATKEETDNLADLLEQMVQDAIAVIPDDSSVEIQEANKSSSVAIYEQLIDKMNAEISKAILGQTLTTEIGGNGSYAAANTHMGIRQDIIDSDKKLVENTINKLIQWIYEINFPDAETPIFELYQDKLKYVYFNAQLSFTLQTQLLLAPICKNDSIEIVEQKINLVARFIDLLIVARVCNYKSVDYSTIKNYVFNITKDIRHLPVSELKVHLLEHYKELNFDIDKSIGNFGLNGFTKKYIKNILARITNYIEEEIGVQGNYCNYMETKTKNPFEIEHIITNHHEYFIDEYPDITEFNNWRNNIGALLLLHKSINASLNDSLYKDKIAKYCSNEGNIYSESLGELAYKNNPRFLRFIKDKNLNFEAFEHFGKEEIRKRNKLVAQLINLVWNTKIFE